jgi:hypothetical protein
MTGSRADRLWSKHPSYAVVASLLLGMVEMALPVAEEGVAVMSFFKAALARRRAGQF